METEVSRSWEGGRHRRKETSQGPEECAATQSPGLTETDFWNQGADCEDAAGELWAFLFVFLVILSW